MLIFVVKIMKIAFISDIHANLEALTAVLDNIDSLKIDKIVCLGDLIGYGPNPSEVVSLIMSRNIPCVKGNHDAASHDDYAMNWMHRRAKVVMKKHIQMLSEEHLDFLYELPVSIKQNNILFVHGSPPDSIYEYARQYDEEKLAYILGQSPGKYFFVGHSHIPFICERLVYPRKLVSSALIPDIIHIINGKADKVLISCGSVGMPRDKYDSKAKYLIFDPSNKTVELKSVFYDSEITLAKMKKLEFPSDIISFLK